MTTTEIVMAQWKAGKPGAPGTASKRTIKRRNERRADERKAQEVINVRG